MTSLCKVSEDFLRYRTVYLRQACKDQAAVQHGCDIRNANNSLHKIPAEIVFKILLQKKWNIVENVLAWVQYLPNGSTLVCFSIKTKTLKVNKTTGLSAVIIEKVNFQPFLGISSRSKKHKLLI